MGHLGYISVITLPYVRGRSSTHCHLLMAIFYVEHRCSFHVLREKIMRGGGRRERGRGKGGKGGWGGNGLSCLFSALSDFLKNSYFAIK